MGKIEVNNLYKIFGNKPQKALQKLKNGSTKQEVLEENNNTVGVNDASFEVKEGEIFVIMGLSGSGKSTLLRCINRLIEPTAGSIKVDGKEVMDFEKTELRKFREKEFGMVFQNFALLPHRTVLENAMFGLEIQNVEKNERVRRAKEALKAVGLDGWEDQHPDQLSGGMQQRVGLARALAVDPEILLMDEPFSALDPLIKKEMQNKLLDLYEEMERTILFITHDLDEALKLGDRIAIMKEGKIIQIGDHEEILTNATNDYVEEFVEDVNRSRVLTARDIMSKAVSLLYPQDGPRTALHKMKKNELSSLFVVDRKKRFKGIVYIEDVVDFINNKDDEKEFKDIIRDITKADPEENLRELFADIADLSAPLPVLDDNEKLLGIIVKTNVLANLAADGDYDKN
ncbi:MAG: glycine betaine/L-proline ABC transporter ATP-binding protein [Halanaerobiales bacterium]|nr:glycine betaine/L-proline ABC transporter ATP-binding protein [Halanaerobiales bacterium]